MKKEVKGEVMMNVHYRKHNLDNKWTIKKEIYQDKTVLCLPRELKNLFTVTQVTVRKCWWHIPLLIIDRRVEGKFRT